MEEAQHLLCSHESARQIMGSNFIDVAEVRKIFPCLNEDVQDLEIIPYSRKSLYLLSEPESNFILFPGIQRCRNRSLTIAEIKRIFCRFPRLFGESLAFFASKHFFIDNQNCLPRWYLMPKKTLDMETAMDFLNGNGIPNKKWGREPAIVYIYARMLFYLLREESIFQNKTFATSDALVRGTKDAQICLNFNDKRILISKWIDQDKDTPNVVPSLKQHI
ncbi:MAG: hypothetical protein HYT03_01740 [Candidatus Harrisonbacteria bacterium]|nr:hypothetical protein [Candidatus Harrisonbacteria bacterium]